MESKFLIVALGAQKKVMEIILGVDKNKRRPIKEAEIVLDNFKHPKNLIERSYYQYLCQKKMYKSFFFNLSLFFLNILLIIPLIIFILFKYKKDKDDNILKKSRNKAVCLQNEKIKDRIPESLLKEFDIIFGVTNGLNLSRREMKFVFRIWKQYPFSITFVAKCTIKIALYHNIIMKNNVKAIIATSEDSYTSSVLTSYCRLMEVEHINIMHGEIYFSLMRAFSAFDRFYIWDQYYEELLSKKLLANDNKFIIERPPCLIYKRNKNLTVPVKYFLQNHNKEQMELVKKFMDRLNKKYMVRPHPIWSHKAYYDNIFDKNVLENYENKDIETSIMESQIIIAWDSTVLLQGYLNGKVVYIDDISNPERFHYMQEAGYILLNKPEVKRLSVLIGGNVNI